jgi:hypothetical protein
MKPEHLERLAAEFLSQSLPKEQWTHGAHLCVGAWHVHRLGADDAIVRLREGIRALNRSHGTPNTETSGYHETITVAYVRLIDQFLSHFDPSISLASRVMHLVAGPLSERAFLFRFWSPDVLMSPAARAEWVSPDRAPLALPPAAVPPESGLG